MGAGVIACACVCRVGRVNEIRHGNLSSIGTGNAMHVIKAKKLLAIDW